MIRYSKLDKAVRKKRERRERERRGVGGNCYRLAQHGLMTELRRLTVVGESLCELNFLSCVLFKCKKGPFVYNCLHTSCVCIRFCVNVDNCMNERTKNIYLDSRWDVTHLYQMCNNV